MFKCYHVYLCIRSFRFERVYLSCHHKTNSMCMCARSHEIIKEGLELVKRERAWDKDWHKCPSRFLLFFSFLCIDVCLHVYLIYFLWSRGIFGSTVCVPSNYGFATLPYIDHDLFHCCWSLM